MKAVSPTSVKRERITSFRAAFPFCLFHRTVREEIGRSIGFGPPEEGKTGPQITLHSRFDGNRIVTSQYTLLNFIPKNLWQQFHKMSNIYFLVIATLQMIPSITTTNGLPTTGIPLCFVLIVNGLKDAYEDWRRFQADNLVNKQVAVRVCFPSRSLDAPRRGVSTTDPHPVDRDYGASAPPITFVDNPTQDAVWEVKDDEEDPAVALSVAIVEHRNEVVGDDFDALQQLQSHVDQQQLKELELDPLIQDNRLEQVQWEALTVGDILLVRNWERFPADLVLLGSSNPQGLVFIETSSLDGETNLKTRQAHPDSAALLPASLPSALQVVAESRGTLECSPPDANLGWFDGVCHLEAVGTTKDLPVTPTQLLLRGCKLRNTTWAVGVVVYTGRDTKIMQNSSECVHKVSQLERYTNKLTALIFLAQLLLCVCGAVMTFVYSWGFQNNNFHYLGHARFITFDLVIARFFTWMVLLQNMIPVALVVTMGMVKAVQALLISYDSDMYHSATKTFAAARTSDLNEELGQVKYLFTDKTGTLTCNCMEFRKCSIRGVNYGKGLTEIRRCVLKKMGQTVPEDSHPIERITPHVNFDDPRLMQTLSQLDHPHRSNVLDFFVHLAINHTVVSEETSNHSIFYSASSPDEGALTYAARHFGVAFVDRQSPDYVLLNVLGHSVHVHVVASLEFSSARKRSSLVCRIEPVPALGWFENRIVVFCKGADSAILPRLANRKDPATAASLEAMASYAEDGLRTLCIAKRDLDSSTLDRWFQQYLEAYLEVTNREDRVEAVAEDIEKELELQGVTGIEDRLQDGVSDTLDAFAAAGIHVWMLTGDKMETAVNIGVATSLLRPSTLQLRYQWDALLTETLPKCKDPAAHNRRLSSARILSPISGDTGPSEHNLFFGPSSRALSPSSGGVADAATGAAPHALLYHKLVSDRQNCIGFASHQAETSLAQRTFSAESSQRTVYARLWENRGLPFCPRRFRGLFRPHDPEDRTRLSSTDVALIIDGQCLAEALKPGLQSAFLELCRLCSTVICCRTTPSQKGAVVSLVKKTEKQVTLAIGDGANDCNMIQSAHVGIGLRGAEGMQAFNVSDYGISQFRFLKILLLCHGRWCYRRLSRLILYMFYKNLLLVLPIFFFAFYSLFSGQKIYFELCYQLYNILFTSIPIMVFGILDQDVSKQKSLAHPQLYHLGQQNVYLNGRVFCRGMLNGLLHSLILFSVAMLTFSSSTVLGSSGRPPGLFFIGHTVFITVMVTINIKILFETALLTWITWVTVIFSLFAWCTAMVLFSSWPSVAPDIIGLLYTMLKTPMFYANLIAAPIIALTLDFIWKASRKTFAVRDSNLAPCGPDAPETKCTKTPCNK